jgi:hypothetical protein
VANAPWFSRSRALTRRSTLLAIALAAILVLGILATTAFFLLRDEGAVADADSITLAMPATDGPPDTTEGDLISHLTVTGGAPDEVELGLYLTDVSGRALMPDAAYAATVELTDLNSGAVVDGQRMNPIAEASTPTFTLDEPGMDSEGWWRVRTTTERPQGNPLTSDFHILLPDPNIRGFDAPPEPETDPAAAEMLTKAIDQISEWDSLRWWEWLSGGNDSLIIAEFAVTTTEANGQPNAFRNDMIFAGGFERRMDGGPPPQPARNHYTAVTIGEQGWTRNEEGEVTERPPSNYLPIDRYPETYQGADQIRFGIEEEIGGRTAQIITFRVPGGSPQSQAWFAFWIDTETADVLRNAMVADSHYMLWIYSDINEPFVIEPPESAEYMPATPTSSPAATPIAHRRAVPDEQP